MNEERTRESPFGVGFDPAQDMRWGQVQPRQGGFTITFTSGDGLEVSYTKKPDSSKLSAMSTRAGHQLHLVETPGEITSGAGAFGLCAHLFANGRLLGSSAQADAEPASQCLLLLLNPDRKKGSYAYVSWLSDEPEHLKERVISLAAVMTAHVRRHGREGLQSRRPTMAPGGATEDADLTRFRSASELGVPVKVTPDTAQQRATPPPPPLPGTTSAGAFGSGSASPPRQRQQPPPPPQASAPTSAGAFAGPRRRTPR